VLDGTGEEAASAAGWVQDHLPKLGVKHVHSELSNGAGGVVLAGVAGALQVA
jgi:hypothetical protein